MPTNDDLIARFEREYQRFHSISIARAREQLKMLRIFSGQLDPRGLLEADGSDLTAFMGTWLDQGQHVNTVRKKANMIRSFYSWAYAAHLYPPELYMRLKSVADPRGATNRSLPNPYKASEVQDFYAWLDHRYRTAPGRNVEHTLSRWLAGKARFDDRCLARHAMHLQVEAIVALALHCGLRRTEIFSLRLVEMHYDNQYVVVRGARKNRRGEVRVREVPYNETAREAVRAWLDFRHLMRPDHDSPWLSITSQGGARNRPMTLEIFKGLFSGRWELRRFRHTCGTERLRSGMKLEKLSVLLGHSSIQQTLGYAQIVESDVYRDLEQTDADFVKRIGRRAA